MTSKSYTRSWISDDPLRFPRFSASLRVRPTRRIRRVAVLRSNRPMVQPSQRAEVVGYTCKVKKKSMNQFTRKGFGRIYVDDAANIVLVKEKIKELDEFEYNYLPDDFIVPFSEYPKLKYTGKFDALNYDKLTAECWKQGIYIFCLDNGGMDWIQDA